MSALESPLVSLRYANKNKLIIVKQIASIKKKNSNSKNGKVYPNKALLDQKAT